MVFRQLPFYDVLLHDFHLLHYCSLAQGSWTHDVSAFQALDCPGMLALRRTPLHPHGVGRTVQATLSIENRVY